MGLLLGEPLFFPPHDPIESREYSDGRIQDDQQRRPTGVASELSAWKAWRKERSRSQSDVWMAGGFR